MKKILSYWLYIKIATICKLQSNIQTSHHDEVMFIAIHQHFELWFSQVILEVEEAIRLLMLPTPDISRATALMTRANQEYALALEGFEVMKTLSRESFCEFRTALEGASGLQSVQFFIIEILTGRKVEELYFNKITGSSMKRFKRKYNKKIKEIANERIALGTLESVYERILKMRNIEREQFKKLENVLLKFGELLNSFRTKHREVAAHILGSDFKHTSGTIQNGSSCAENLRIGLRSRALLLDIIKSQNE